MFNGDGGGAMTGNNDVINNNKRAALFSVVHVPPKQANRTLKSIFGSSVSYKILERITP